jgi:hypothetical protein
MIRDKGTEGIKESEKWVSMMKIQSKRSPAEFQQIFSTRNQEFTASSKPPTVDYKGCNYDCN